MEDATELACPECGHRLSRVWQFVTEQRKYQFSLIANEYVGRSDPVDDSSKLDSIVCPQCFDPLPKALVEELFEQFDALSVSP